MRSALLLLLIAGTSHAQMAVTDNGTLYFTSNLSTVDGDTNPQSKIFRLDNTGLTLIASGQGTTIFAPAAINPLTSGDGTITGYGMNTPCGGGSCGFFALPRTRFTITGIELSPNDYNSLAISRNGKFLAGTTFDSRTRILSPATAAQRQLPQFTVMRGEPSVSDAGTIVAWNAYGTSTDLLLAALDKEPAPIPGTSGATVAQISPSGRYVIYQRAANGGSELVLTDPSGASHTVLAISQEQNFPFHPTFANDDSLLYLVPRETARQAALRRPDGAVRPLPTVAAGVSNAILQGDGHGAWLVSNSGQYLYVNLDRGDQATERIPATPAIQLTSFFGFPGSVVRFTGNGLGKDTIITVDGIRYPIQEVYGQVITVQIPWEVSPTSGSLPMVVQGPDTPFRQRTVLTILPAPTISFERDLRTGVLQAAHQDFRGVVTESDPALAGETIHIFARNMGPVDQTLATGAPSPAAPPTRVITPLACYLRAYKSQSEPYPAQGVVVPFAGLAGNSVGVYQIDVTIPAGWPSGRANVSCTMPTARNSFGGDSADLLIAQ